MLKIKKILRPSLRSKIFSNWNQVEKNNPNNISARNRINIIEKKFLVMDYFINNLQSKNVKLKILKINKMQYDIYLILHEHKNSYFPSLEEISKNRMYSNKTFIYKTVMKKKISRTSIIEKKWNFDINRCLSIKLFKLSLFMLNFY